MTFICLVLSLTAAFIGTVTCFRVPLARRRRRIGWGAVLLALLALCAGLLLVDPGKSAGQARTLGAVELLLLVLGCAGAAIPGGSVISAAVLGLAHRTGDADGSGPRLSPGTRSGTRCCAADCGSGCWSGPRSSPCWCWAGQPGSA